MLIRRATASALFHIASGVTLATLGMAMCFTTTPKSYPSIAKMEARADTVTDTGTDAKGTSEAQDETGTGAQPQPKADGTTIKTARVAADETPRQDAQGQRHAPTPAMEDERPASPRDGADDDAVDDSHHDDNHDKDAPESEPSQPGPMASFWPKVAHLDRCAHDDGSIVEWAPGYYVAHDWSEPGQILLAAEIGSVIEVNGVPITICDMFTVPDDAIYEDIRANVGPWLAIFQTCYDETSTLILTGTGNIGPFETISPRAEWERAKEEQETTVAYDVPEPAQQDDVVEGVVEHIVEDIALEHDGCDEVIALDGNDA